MSIVELETLSNDELKKRVTSLISLEDWSDSCRACGIPSLLHKDGPCTRQEREPPDVVMKVWTEFKRRVKPILATLKENYRKEVEQCSPRWVNKTHNSDLKTECGQHEPLYREYDILDDLDKGHFQEG